MSIAGGGVLLHTTENTSTSGIKSKINIKLLV